jgi:hypothetical protein
MAAGSSAGWMKKQDFDVPLAIDDNLCRRGSQSSVWRVAADFSDRLLAFVRASWKITKVGNFA